MKDTFNSNEIVTHQQYTGDTYGVSKVTGQLSGVISALTYSALLASVESPLIRALVLDSAFADFAPVLRTQFKQISGLPNVFLTGALLGAQLLTGERLAMFRPLEVLSQVTAKLLVIHAAGDTFISPDHALDFVKVTQAQHWITGGDSHLASYRNQPDEYAARVTAFLQSHLNSTQLPIQLPIQHPTQHPARVSSASEVLKGANHDAVSNSFARHVSLENQ